MSADQAPVEPTPPHYSTNRPPIGGASMALFALMIAGAIFSAAYQFLVRHQMHQGIAMFIGLPVVLGTIVAFATYPRSPLGMVFKVTTLVLCVIAPLLAEGAICIAMAAPIIFAFIGLGALLVRLLSPTVGRGKASCCAALLGLLPFAWEPSQKPPGWEDKRPLEEVSDSIDLDAPPSVIWSALDTAPIDPKSELLPMFMRLRLRAGVRTVTGRGLAPGSTRDILFDEDHYVATVTQTTPEREAVFAIRELPAGHGERIALWLRFVEVRFTLEDLGAGRTRLTQVTRYRRLLDPELYFAPLERQGVHAMHRYTLALLTTSLHPPAAP